MSSDSYDPDAECIEHRLIVNGTTLTAKKIRGTSMSREIIIVHTLTIGDRSIRFKEVKFNGTTKKTLLTRMSSSKFKKFKSDWAKLWNPALSDDYNSLSDIEKESTSEDDGSYITVTEEIGSTITVNGIKYKVLEFIASGGSSEVYRTQEYTKEPVAIKKVFLDNPRSAEKFRQEVSLLKRLKSKKWIVDLLDYEELERPSGNILYEVLELGETDLDCLLRERKNKKRNLTDKEIKNLWTQMVKAVNAIHSVGILHLDLKPGNFILMKTGRLKLIDFGLSLSIPDPPPMHMLRETTCGKINKAITFKLLIYRKALSNLTFYFFQALGFMPLLKLLLTTLPLDTIW